MVKGVNKTVIEICDTGNKMFEKVVFYVTPQYSQANARRLQKAARDFAFRFEEPSGAYLPLRARKRRISFVRAALLFGTPLLVIGGIVLLIVLH